MAAHRKTRLSLELQVGNTHLVQVIVYLRRKDVDWFYEGAAVKDELLELLSARIVPQEFGDIIEAYHEKKRPDYFKNKKRKGAGIGEKNVKAKINSKHAKRNNKRKKNDEEPEDEGPKKPRREVTHANTSKLHISYRLQTVKKSESVSLLMVTGEEKHELAFRQLTKLPKQIELWCFPPRDDDATEPDDEDGGFPRPELVPISEIFRAPI